MKVKAIVYTSNSGFTAQYADMLGSKLSLPVYELTNALNNLSSHNSHSNPESNAEIIYLGWLFASKIKGYAKAAKKFKIVAVCGVGLCDTGALKEEVRKANSLQDQMPLFTLQGGLDRAKLRGVNKVIIKMLTNGLASQKTRSETDERMLTLLQEDKSYVSEQNLSAFLEWYTKNAQ